MGKKTKSSKKNKLKKKSSAKVALIPSTIYEYLGAIHPAITEFGNSQETIDMLIELWELYCENEPEIRDEDVYMDEPCERVFLSGVCTNKYFNRQTIIDLDYKIDLEQGIPFLDLAALYGILELLEYFVEVLEFSLDDAYSILPNAIASGNMEVVDYLISKGFIPDTIADGILSFSKDIFCMEHLLAQGFEIQGDSFNIAAQDCDITLLHFLMERLGPENLTSINIIFEDLVYHVFMRKFPLEDIIRFFDSFINLLPFQYLMLHRAQIFISICNRCNRFASEELVNVFINLLKNAGVYDNEFAINMIQQLSSHPRFNTDSNIIYIIRQSIDTLPQKVISTYCCICNCSTNYHCDICKTTYYCSRTCQRVDWLNHKQICALADDYISCANSLCMAVADSVCGKCKITHYCSKDCQLAHWPVHKKCCNK